MFLLGIAAVAGALSCSKPPSKEEAAQAIKQMAVQVDQTGLLGEYFDNKDLTAPRLSRIDKKVDIDFQSNSPSSADFIGGDTFSIRWSGFVEPKFTESYTFMTQNDDGVRLWVNGTKVIDDWNNHSVATKMGTPIALQAGVKVPIVLEYYDDTGAAEIHLRWKSATQVDQVIPTEQLKPSLEACQVATGLVGHWRFDEAAPKFTVTGNTYNRNDEWGGITFQNDGAIPSSNYRVEFDIPTNAHCTNDSVPAGAVLSPLTGSGTSAHTTGNHCIYTWSAVTPLTSAPAKTFNYSTDAKWVSGTESFTQATNIVITDANLTRTAFDQTCNANHAVLRSTTSPPRVPGKFGLATNHTNQMWVRAPDSDSIDSVATSNQISVTAWVKPSSLPAGYISIVSRQIQDTGGEHFGLTFKDGKASFHIETNTSGTKLCSAPTVSPTGQWIHLAGTYDGQTARAYVNGQQVCSFARTALLGADSTPLTIGGAYNQPTDVPTELFSGLIDHVSLYNRALTATEIADFFRGSSDNICQGPGMGSSTTASRRINGLIGEYYDGKASFTSPKLSKVDPQIDFAFTPSTIDPTLGTDTFTVRWRGTVIPRFAEMYTFTTRTDDGVRLYIDDRLVIDDWNDHSAKDNSGSIFLDKREHAVVFEYYQGSGSAEARLFWQSAHQPKEIVPSSQLLPRNSAVCSVPGDVVGHWTFDDPAHGLSLHPIAAGSAEVTVLESTCNGNHGTLRSFATTDYVDGKRGQALTFNGSNNWVRVNSTPSFNQVATTNQVTAAAWVKLSQSKSGYANVVMRQFQTSGSEHWSLTFRDGKFRWYINSQDSGTSFCEWSSTPSLNTWYHLAGTFDGSTARAYVNGAQVCSFSRTGTLQSDTRPIVIGAGLNDATETASEFFAGSIDDVGVWSRALSSQEISGLWSGGSSGTICSVSCPDLPLQPCEAPSDVVGTISASPRVVVLNWKDNTSRETGYQIFRNTMPGIAILLGSVGPNVTTFTDTDPRPGRRHAYVVVAKSPNGDSPAGVVELDIPGTTKGCVGKPDQTPCSDGDRCNGDEVCINETCTAGTPVTCPGATGTGPICDPSNGQCVALPAAYATIDPDAALTNGDFTFVNSVGTCGVVATANPGLLCVRDLNGDNYPDTYVNAQGVFIPVGQPGAKACMDAATCDDGDKCTDTSCNAGHCFTQPKLCTDGFLNTVPDSCDPATGNCTFVTRTFKHTGSDATPDPEPGDDGAGNVLGPGEGQDVQEVGGSECTVVCKGESGSKCLDCGSGKCPCSPQNTGSAIDCAMWDKNGNTTSWVYYKCATSPGQPGDGSGGSGGGDGSGGNGGAGGDGSGGDDGNGGIQGGLGGTTGGGNSGGTTGGGNSGGSGGGSGGSGGQGGSGGIDDTGGEGGSSGSGGMGGTSGSGGMGGTSGSGGTAGMGGMGGMAGTCPSPDIKDRESDQASDEVSGSFINNVNRNANLPPPDNVTTLPPNTQGGAAAGDKGATIQGEIAGIPVPPGTTPVPQGLGPNVESLPVVGPTTDPIHMFNGELVIEENDLSYPGTAVPFSFVRTYRSRVSLVGPLGFSWDHPFNQHLRVIDTENIEFSTGSAQTINFVFSSPGIFRPSSTGVPMILVEETNGSFTLTDSSGLVRRFTSGGLLSNMTDQNGFGLRINRDSQSRVGTVDLDFRLDQPSNPSRQVTFTYDPTTGLLKQLDGPGGLKVTYTYYAGRSELQTSTNASGRVQEYVYRVKTAGCTGTACFEAPEARDPGIIPQSAVASSCEVHCAADPEINGTTPNPSACIQTCTNNCENDCRDHATSGIRDDSIPDLSWDGTFSTPLSYCLAKRDDACSALKDSFRSKCPDSVLVEACNGNCFRAEDPYQCPDPMTCKNKAKTKCDDALVDELTFTCKDQQFVRNCIDRNIGNCVSNSCNPQKCNDACNNFVGPPAIAACTSGCVGANYAAMAVAAKAPRYGYKDDLNHNIVEVKNGAHEREVFMVYGEVTTKPEFDAVTSQEAGSGKAVGQGTGPYTMSLIHNDLLRRKTPEIIEQICSEPENSNNTLQAKATRGVDFTDAYGVTWEFLFDAQGNKVKETNTDDIGTVRVRKFNYDGSGHVLGSLDADGAKTCFVYDGNDLKFVRRYPIGGHKNTLAVTKLETKYTWRKYTNGMVRLDKVEFQGNVVEDKDYDDKGNLITLKDRTGRELATYTIQNGVPTVMTAHDAQSTSGETKVLFTYDKGIVSKQTIAEKGSETDPSSSATATVPDEAGRPHISTTAYGEQTEWFWDTDGTLKKMTVTNASATVDGAAGNVSYTTRYTYDANKRVQSVRTEKDDTAEENARQEFSYDKVGNVNMVKVFLPGSTTPSKTTCFVSGPDGRRLAMMSPRGNMYVFEYDGDGRLVTTLLNPNRFFRFPTGCPAQVADPKGGVLVNNVYDEAGRLVKQVRGDADLDTGDGTNSITYDAFGRPITTEDARGSVSQQLFDAEGRIKWKAVYDRGCGPIGFGKPGDMSAPGLLSLVEYEYFTESDPAPFNNDGRLKRETVNYFAKKPTAMTGGGCPDLHANFGQIVTDYTYSDLERKTVLTTSANGQSVQKSTIGDGHGRPVKQILVEGSNTETREYIYDVAGRKLTVKAPALTGASGSGELTTTSTLTTWGAVQKVTVKQTGGSNEVTQQTNGYDRFKRQEVVDGLAGGRTTTVFDAFGRLSTVTLKDGSNQVTQNTYTYDLEDLISTVTSTPAGGTATAVTSYTRDSLGRVKKITRPGGGVYRYGYIGATELRRWEVRPNGALVNSQYDIGDRLSAVKIGQPVSGTVISDATNLDDLPETALDLKVTRTMQHDGLRRLVSVVQQPVASTGSLPAHVNTFGWDSLGQQISESDDGTNRTIKVTASEFMKQRTLDLGGLVTINNAWNQQARTQTSSVTAPGGGSALATTTFSGFVAGAPRTRTSAGLTTTFEFNELGVPTAHRFSGTIASGGWTWKTPADGIPRVSTLTVGSFTRSSVAQLDNLGRLVKEDNDIPSVSGIPAITTFTSTADANAAASEWFGGANVNKPRTYELDGRNNWVTRDFDGVNIAYLPNAFDQLTGTASYYPSGELQQLANGANYTYDILGNLSEARFDPSNVRKTYFYDGLDRLIEEQLDTNATPPVPVQKVKYAYFGIERSIRENADGSTTATVNSPGTDEHLAIVNQAPNGGARTVHYLHQDRQGSVYMATDASGQPEELYTYSAYGERTVRSPSGTVLTGTQIGNYWGYQGHAHDATTGLVQMRARWYEPKIGRFLSPDPMGLAAGMNAYAFAKASPLAFTDPLGLKEGPAPWWRAAGDFVWQQAKQQIDQAVEVATVVGKVGLSFGSGVVRGILPVGAIAGPRFDNVHPGYEIAHGVGQMVGGFIDHLGSGALLTAGGAACTTGVGCVATAAAVTGAAALEANAYAQQVAGGVTVLNGIGRLLAMSKQGDSPSPSNDAPSSTTPSGGSDFKVSPERRVHILEGDPPGTGHGSGPGRNNTEGVFPKTWTDDQVIGAIERVANSPNSTWKQTTGPGFVTAPVTTGGPSPTAPALTNRGTPVRFSVRGQTYGVNVEVIVEPGPGGEGIVTGWSNGH